MPLRIREILIAGMALMLGLAFLALLVGQV
jgi:hypothetical protein